MEEGKYRMKKLLPKEFLEDVVRLPYKPNPQDNPQHENQIEELLIKHKLNYIAQPNGSQNYPDFTLPDHDLDIECKSVAKGLRPKWNCSLPKSGVLYIFSSGNKKLNRTTMFLGQDVCPPESYKILAEIAKDNKERNDKHKEMYKKIGWAFNVRKDFNNMGLNSPDYWDESLPQKVFKHFGF
jgi:hypothetical protein